MSFSMRNPASVAAMHSADCGSRQKATGWSPRWGMRDVGFQRGLEIGAALAQPVHHRVLRRYHRRPPGAQDAAELGERGRAVAGVVNDQRTDDKVEGAIG